MTDREKRSAAKDFAAYWKSAQDMAPRAKKNGAKRAKQSKTVTKKR